MHTAIKMLYAYCIVHRLNFLLYRITTTLSNSNHQNEFSNSQQSLTKLKY